MESYGGDYSKYMQGHGSQASRVQETRLQSVSKLECKLFRYLAAIVSAGSAQMQKVSTIGRLLFIHGYLHVFFTRSVCKTTGSSFLLHSGYNKI